MKIENTEENKRKLSTAFSSLLLFASNCGRRLEFRLENVSKIIIDNSPISKKIFRGY